MAAKAHHLTLLTTTTAAAPTTTISSTFRLTARSTALFRYRRITLRRALSPLLPLLQFRPIPNQTISLRIPISYSAMSSKLFSQKTSNFTFLLSIILLPLPFCEVFRVCLGLDNWNHYSRVSASILLLRRFRLV